VAKVPPLFKKSKLLLVNWSSLDGERWISFSLRGITLPRVNLALSQEEQTIFLKTFYSPKILNLLGAAPLLRRPSHSKV
jgi:hypothetical protein